MAVLDPESSWSSITTPILASGYQAVMAVTGGGSGAISALLETPGASRVVLEAAVPYSAAALAEWLGGVPEQACAGPTARAMAMAAFRRARHLAPQHSPHQLVGVGGTASLASDRPKRGDHRVFIAIQTARSTVSFALTLQKGHRDRRGEELLVSELVLRTLAAVVCAGESPDAPAAPAFTASERGEFDRQDGTPALTELLLGVRTKILLEPRSGLLSERKNADHDAALPVLLPGAFNPPHAGHLEMAAVAQRRLGAPVAWELSIANVDKPPLDFIAIRDRVAAIAAQDGQRPLVLTSAATFREKATVFPGATFVIGADTAVRIGEDRYYDNDSAQRDAAIKHIASQGCRFLVFGRHHAGRFQSLGELALPPALQALCDEVTAAEFRQDISSTQLRALGGV